MNLLKLFNPQGWTGQLILLGLFAATFTLTGWILGQNFQIKITPDPKPTTQINNDIDNKVKRGGMLTSGISTVVTDCDSLFSTMDKREALKYVRGLYRD